MLDTRNSHYIVCRHCRVRSFGVGHSPETGASAYGVNVTCLDDVELAILTGEILERQRDRASAEWKYRLQGEATDARPVITRVLLSWRSCSDGGERSTQGSSSPS